MNLNPDDERDLSRYFSGELLADMGLRSTTGAKLQACKEGIIREAGGGYEMDERALEASMIVGRIQDALGKLSVEAVRILRLFYSPMTVGQRERLEQFGAYGNVVAYLAGGRAKVLGLVHMSRCNKAKLTTQTARTEIYVLVGHATSKVHKARSELADALWRCPRCRRWYILRGEE